MGITYGESILIKMTPEDINAIKAKMEQAGVKNRSAYIRKMAIDGYIIVLDLSDIKEVVRLIRINSNNLNQYAKKANETGSIYEEDIGDLNARLDEIWESSKEIMARLATIQ